MPNPAAQDERRAAHPGRCPTRARRDEIRQQQRGQGRPAVPPGARNISIPRHAGASGADPRGPGDDMQNRWI